ncbi:hypothetical protein CVIRNUC_010438 [Coccomyxa viridis]|uniref:Ionotropic glutamate receptor C-terminal domain-containing protein n=1 Tax=Coccomyxa viridis TaxID=1274662 RepID=A0AAV1IKL2_9CHLO|nr:hypothetical protein CVIRNUC_010438 [Coccomyxa viridis]
MVLQVAVANGRRPFTFINPDRDGQAAFSGVLVDLLPDLLDAAGFNKSDLHYYAPKSQGSGSQLPNGTWTGMTGELTAGRADVILTQLTATSYREEFADQSFAILDAKMALMVHADTLRPQDAFTFLQPFSWELWVCLVLFVFGVALVLTVLARLSPMGLFDIRKVAVHVKGTSGDVTRQYAIHDVTRSFLLDTWLTATGQTPLPQGRSWAIRMIAISYGLFSLLVIASYTASFAAILTLKTYRYSVNDRQDLANSNLKFGIDAGGVTQYYFKHPHDDLSTALSDQYITFPGVAAALDAIRNKTIAGYITQESLLDYIASLQPCDMAIVDRGWGYGSQVIGFQKNSTITAPLNDAILKLRENGRVDQLMRGWHVPACNAQAQGGIDQLQLPSFAGLWYFLFIFWGLAVLVTLVERLIIWIGHRYPRLRHANAKIQHLLFSANQKHFDYIHSEAHFGRMDSSLVSTPRK